MLLTRASQRNGRIGFNSFRKALPKTIFRIPRPVALVCLAGPEHDTGRIGPEYLESPELSLGRTPGGQPLSSVPTAKQLARCLRRPKPFSLKQLSIQIRGTMQVVAVATWATTEA